MEPSNKLADLTLVSKYYPFANYSYPRSPSFSRSHRGSTDRSSFGSAGSAPGLIDDRTDSEASADDDYQYHAHGTELWDSFWQSESDEKKEPKDDFLTNPRRNYPALVPSPERQKRNVSQDSVSAISWPLPEAKSQVRARKPSTTYSPFPKPVILPAPNLNPTPSWTSTRHNGIPQRPPRPDNELLMPCVRESSDRLVVKTGVAGALKNQRSFNIRPVPQTTTQPAARPIFKTIDWNRPATSQGTRPTSPLEPTASALYDAYGRLRANSAIQNTSTLLHIPSTIDIPTLEREPEPQSVFEFDDEDEPAPESHSRKFFLFHRRADSDRGRAAESTETKTSRKRANTTPPQTRYRKKSETPSRRRQVDVWSRMLGRRSR